MKNVEKLAVFDRELNLIKNDNLRKFVVYFLTKEVPNYFWYVAASSNGKYHPASSLGIGGLVRHTKRVVKAVEKLLQNHSIVPEDSVDADLVYAAAILHDTFKRGTKDDVRDYSVYCHPRLVADKIRGLGWEELGDVVECHMGQWTKADDKDGVVYDGGERLMPRSDSAEERLLSMADYVASIKFD